MELTPKAKPPVPMTMHQMLLRLMAVMEQATPEERELFKRAWLDSSLRFEAETRRMRSRSSRSQGS